MDQSALNYEMIPKKTIERKGSQKVPVMTKGGEKKRATILSLINSAGEKYKQFIIVKGVHNAQVHEAMQQSNDESTQFSAQENAWTDQKQLESWLESVWWPIARSTEEPKLLVLDSYPLHKTLQNEFAKYNTIVKFIPTGLTGVLQPLDGLYHKSYKKFAKDFFLYNQNKTIKNEEEWRALLVSCVKEVYSKMSHETILKSWKAVGLENPNSELIPFVNEDSMIVEVDNTFVRENGSMLIEMDNTLVKDERSMII